MTRQSLVAQHHGQADPLGDQLGPGARELGLRPVDAARFERQTHHELPRIVLEREPLEGGGVGLGITTPAQRGERSRAAAVAVRDRDADPPLPQVDAQQPRHGGGDSPPSPGSTLPNG
jgi:hypothetical protein